MPITITFSTAGSFTIEDDGIPGNNTSIVRRDSDGAILAVIPHPADALIFRAIVPGVNLTFNITDSLGAASLTVGSLTNSAETPDSVTVKSIKSSGAVTLVSNGGIVEGGADVAADIVAGSLILSAGTGVGTGVNAMETETGLLEAETTTGGITISNIGNLQVGGFSANVDGLDVVTSGNIVLTNLGTITLSDETSFDSVHGGDTSGDVTLIANGYDSDITSSVDQSSIIAPRGSVFLTAGRDVSFGLAGTEFGNDVRANGSIVVNAGRDFLVSGFADFFADGVLGNTGGNLIANAGRNISILDDTGNSGSLAVLGSGGGSIILTTGVGGQLTLETPSTNTISSGSGSVIVNADRIVISSTSGITAPGDVTLRPVSDGRAISLGSLSDGANAIELSDGELDRIFANTLILGSDTTGSITVGAPIAPGSITNFTLRSGADIFVNSSLTAPNALSLFAGDNLFQLGAAVLTATTLNALVDQVGDDGGVGAAGLLLGTVAATNITLGGNGEADNLTGAPDVDQIVHGNGGNDRIVSSGEGSYFGDAGDDLMFAGLSSGLVPEVLNGGAGIDTLDTTSFTSAYTINMTTGATDYGYESFVNFENLISGSGADSITGTSGDNNIQTGSGNDTIMGLAGNDTLDGGLGADSMNGGGGNDTFIVDDPGDVVIEVAGLGTDTVLSSVSFSLAGISIEVLTLTGGAAINGTGNAQAQTINGNGAANGLYGMNGDDVLNGFGGNDILDGGAGADTMAGGLGDDVFFVESASDLVIEAAGEGYDTVFTTVNYALGSHADRLVTFNPASTAALSLTGNALANEITGNAGANIIDGGAGADLMVGGNGNDIYFVDNAGDVVSDAPGGGFDTVFSSISFVLDTLIERVVAADTSATTALNFTGNDSVNEITGNNGSNMIDGRGGADLLFGNGGSDAFLFTTALGGGNIDSLPDYQPGVDRLYLDDAIFTGLVPGALPAGAFRIGSAAADADDRIIYNSVTGVLLFDADGNGAGAAVQFATLHEALAITASDFQII